MKMKNFIITPVFFLAAMLVASAQEISKPREMGGGGFTIGYGNMDVSGLHVFVPENVKDFRNDHLVIGGAGYGIVDRFVIGGSGFGMIGDDITTDSLKISLGGGLGTFDFGYLLLSAEKMKIFPLIGIGGGGYGLNIARNKNVTVNEILENPGQEINIGIGGFVADVSLNINVIPVFNYDEKENAYGGFMTGLKAGYIYSLPSSSWSFTGGDIINGPDFNLSMFYVKIIIGGFGYKKPE